MYSYDVVYDADKVGSELLPLNPLEVRKALRASPLGAKEPEVALLYKQGIARVIFKEELTAEEEASLQTSIPMEEIESVQKKELIRVVRQRIKRFCTLKELGGFTANVAAEGQPEDLVFVETRRSDREVWLSVREDAHFAITTNDTLFKFPWIMRNDEIRTLTAQDCLAITDQIKLHIGTQKYKANALKKGLNALTISQLKAYDVESNWPA